MKKKYKILLIVIIVLIIVIIAAIVAFKFLKGSEPAEPVKVVDRIDNFDYTLDDRDTELMKNTYNELKTVLSSDEIDYEKYAEILSKLFVIDLFTMDNKVNRYDVGSTEYVYPDSVDNFKTNVEDTIYKSMENNSDGKRRQDLPEVSSIDNTSVETSTFTIGEEEHESFVVNINWSYVSDLGYDDNATITLIELNEKLYVVEYVTGE
ncbi:MAG TPA: hypothetical protein IAB40_04975 [Candidatus Onthocola stercoravium]|nr:hypothetical protein [Candidatus Onthocola stercoravium]